MCYEELNYMEELNEDDIYIVELLSQEERREFERLEELVALELANGFEKRMNDAVGKPEVFIEKDFIVPIELLNAVYERKDDDDTNNTRQKPPDLPPVAHGLDVYVMSDQKDLFHKIVFGAMVMMLFVAFAFAIVNFVLALRDSQIQHVPQHVNHCYKCCER